MRRGVAAQHVADRAAVVAGQRPARRGEADALVGADEPMALVARARLDGHLALGVEEEGGVGADRSDQLVEQSLVGQGSVRQRLVTGDEATAVAPVGTRRLLGELLLRSWPARRPAGPTGSRRARLFEARPRLAEAADARVGLAQREEEPALCGHSLTPASSVASGLVRPAQRQQRVGQAEVGVGVVLVAVRGWCGTS